MSEPKQPLEPTQPNAPELVGESLSRVRQEPGRAMASAFVVGLILSVFPVGRIVSFFLSLVLTLARPILLVLGGFKVWEEVNRRRK
jgi:hypothetical protein